MRGCWGLANLLNVKEFTMESVAHFLGWDYNEFVLLGTMRVSIRLNLFFIEPHIKILTADWLSKNPMFR
jgi:antibiotic biosynthesis monooxygenase (ABM) superfamily enzyme